MKRRIIGVTVIAAALWWVLDSAVDYFLFYDGTFLGVLLTNLEPVEICIRLLGVVGILSTGLVVAHFYADRNIALSKLRESEALYRGLSEKSEDLVWKCDKIGCYTYLNPAWERLLGYKLSEMLGRPFTEFRDPENAARDWAAFLKAPGRVEDAHEITLISRTGEKVHLLSSVVPLFDDDGRPIGIQGAATDITVRKKIEERLRESEERMELALEGADLGTWDWNVKTGDVKFNERWARMLGYALDEIVSRVDTWAELVHPDDMPRVQTLLDAHLDGKTESYETEHRMRHKSGTWIWVLDKGRVFERDADGKPLRACGTHLDITERKRTEEALRTSESNLQEAQRIAKLGHYVLDVTSGLWTSSDELDIIFGIGKDTTRDVGLWLQIVHPEFREIMSDYFQDDVLRQHLNFDKEYKIIDGMSGQQKWVHGLGYLRFDNHGEPTEMFGTIQDITERKRAEESDARFNHILEGSLNEIFIFDAETYRFVEVNRGAQKNLGYSIEELRDLTPLDLKPEFTAEQFTELIEPLRTGLEEKIEFTTVHRRKDGSLYPIEVHLQLMNHGAPVYVAIVLDITERKRTEKSLREIHEQLQTSIARMPIAYIMLDPDLCVVEWNQSAEEIFGFAKEDAVGQSVVGLIVPEKDHAIVTEVLGKLAEGETVSYPKKDNNIRQDGTLISCQWYNTPIIDAHGELQAILCMAEDVTQRLRAEEELLRAKRLESAGQLAGQIAHDFNNLLGPLMAYPEMIALMIPPDEKIAEMLDDMTRAAEQIAEINQDLLTLGRRGHYNLAILDLNCTISDALRPLERESCSNVHFLPADDLSQVKGGGAQIARVLCNLVNNAGEANRGTGTITVATQNVALTEPGGNYTALPAGEYVRIDVKDTGTGIDAETLSRIFEPFFTTKTTDRKRGSGLGLTVVHAVMEDHDGFVDVCSTVGQGTTFSLYFPVANGAAVAEQTIRRDEHPTGHGETVLVVDDDAMQLRIAQTMLTKLGYQVSVAASGEEALEFIADHPQNIVLLDMVMEAMNGVATLRAIRELYPDQIALIISGFAPNDQAAEAQQLGAQAFLQKPIKLAALATALQEALRPRRPESTPA